MWIVCILALLMVVTICAVVYIFSVINQKFLYFNERVVQKRQFIEWIIQLAMPYFLLPVFLFFHKQLVGEGMVRGEKIYYITVLCFFGILLVNSISKSFLIWREIKSIKTRRIEA